MCSYTAIGWAPVANRPLASYTPGPPPLSPLSNVFAVLILASELSGGGSLVGVYPSRLPLAEGYFSLRDFPLPRVTSPSRLLLPLARASLLGASWKPAGCGVLGSSWQPARCGAYLERRHYLTFTLSGSHVLNLEKCLLGGVSWCANPSRLPLRVTHLRDFILPLAGGAYSETEQTCREELTRSGRTLDLHTSCLLTKATSGYTDLIWRNASGVFTAPFRGSPASHSP